MKNLICLLFILTNIFNLIHAQADRNTNDIEQLLSKEDKAGFSGTVLVIKEGEVLLNKGYGFTDKRQLHQVTPNTIFNIASITKTFTAIGILKLVEQGKLNLEDQISSFFKEIPQDKKGITIHQLLTHSSGLPHGYVCMKISEGVNCMKAIWKEELEDSPGRVFNYSNHNYAVLAAIIETISGTSWEDYISKNILERAQMGNTYFWGAIDDRDAVRVAQKLERLSHKTRRRNWDYLGSGGMYTTSEDLYKWFQALQSGDILSEKYKKLLFKPTLYSKSGIVGIGYGWFVSKTAGMMEYWTRGSESFGHNAVLRWFPEKETLVIICTNTGEKGDKKQSDNRRISELIIDIIL